MSLAMLIPLALRLSIAVIVFALGLQTPPAETSYLFRRPELLLRSVLSINVVMPLAAVLLVTSFNLPAPVRIAVVVLSVSPMPPMLPRKSSRTGGHSYLFSLVVTEATLSILLIPASIALLSTLFEWQANVSALEVGAVVSTTVVVPLGAGMVLGSFAPGFAEKLARPASLAATILLTASTVPILFIELPAIVALTGNGTLAAMILFDLAGLAVGHLFGGPAMENRTTLALSTSSRHPGVALTIATTNFPNEQSVLAAIILYLIVNTILSIPYLIWQRYHIGIHIGGGRNGSMHRLS